MVHRIMSYLKLFLPRLSMRHSGYVGLSLYSILSTQKAALNLQLCTLTASYIPPAALTPLDVLHLQSLLHKEADRKMITSQC